MKTETSKNIVSYIKSKTMASPRELAIYLKISPQAIHRQLQRLLEDGTIQKLGAPPNTLYKISDIKTSFLSLESSVNEHPYHR